jgi:hypothetical protein
MRTIRADPAAVLLPFAQIVRSFSAIVIKVFSSIKGKVVAVSRQPAR